MNIVLRKNKTAISSRKLTRSENISIWIHFNSETLGIIITLIILAGIYCYFIKGTRKIDFSEFTSKVELLDFEYKKIYTPPGVYYNEAKLDKVIFKLKYNYNDTEFESNSILYKEYISLELEKIIENHEIKNLDVRCNKDFPDRSIVIPKLK